MWHAALTTRTQSLPLSPRTHTACKKDTGKTLNLLPPLGGLISASGAPLPEGKGKCNPDHNRVSCHPFFSIVIMVLDRCGYLSSWASLSDDFGMEEGGEG